MMNSLATVTIRQPILPMTFAIVLEVEVGLSYAIPVTGIGKLQSITNATAYFL
jgi:hypothetical protein